MSFCSVKDKRLWICLNLCDPLGFQDLSLGQDESSMSDSIVSASVFDLIIGLSFKKGQKEGFVKNSLAFNFPE